LKRKEVKREISSKRLETTGEQREGERTKIFKDRKKVKRRENLRTEREDP